MRVPLRLLATTYPDVRRYILLNEPNEAYFQVPQIVRGRIASATTAFTALAKGYDALKSVDPTIDVIGLALSPEANDRTSMSPVRFLDAVGRRYRRSGRTKPLMDELALHLYPKNAARHDQNTQGGQAAVPERSATRGRKPPPVVRRGRLGDPRAAGLLGPQPVEAPDRRRVARSLRVEEGLGRRERRDDTPDGRRAGEGAARLVRIDSRHPPGRAALAWALAANGAEKGAPAARSVTVRAGRRPPIRLRADLEPDSYSVVARFVAALAPKRETILVRTLVVHG